MSFELEDAEYDHLLDVLEGQPFKDISGLVTKIKNQRSLQDTKESHKINDVEILLG
jgi:hypothetical protein